jgi:SagB-type dehydrogenase family enzyme
MKRKQVITLPQPAFTGRMSLEAALHARRTVRSFAPTPLSLNQLSQLLWATYGMTDHRREKKTAPSAGALYPLDCYLAVGDEGVLGVEGGVYHYLPPSHALDALVSGDRRREIARASLRQMWMAEAPVMVIITAEYQRITGKYRARGVRYAHMEVGHAGENLFLQCCALGLGAGIVGAFDDDAVTAVLGLPPAHEPLLIVPLGHPR